LNWLDIILIIPLLYGLVMGAKRGFVKEAVMLVAIAMGVFVAKLFSSPASLFLQEHLGASPRVARPLSYFVVMVVFVGGMYVLAWMLTKILKAMKLGTANRIFGAVLGTLKWVLILSVVLNFFAVIDRYVPIKSKESVQNSKLYAPIESASRFYSIKSKSIDL